MQLYTCTCSSMCVLENRGERCVPMFGSPAPKKTRSTLKRTHHVKSHTIHGSSPKKVHRHRNSVHAYLGSLLEFMSTLSPFFHANFISVLISSHRIGVHRLVGSTPTPGPARPPSVRGLDTLGPTSYSLRDLQKLIVIIGLNTERTWENPWFH